MSETSKTPLYGEAERKIEIHQLDPEKIHHIVTPSEYDLDTIDLEAYLPQPRRRSMKIQVHLLDELEPVFDKFKLEKCEPICFVDRSKGEITLFLDAPLRGPRWADEVISLSLGMHPKMEFLKRNNERWKTHSEVCNVLQDVSSYIEMEEMNEEQFLAKIGEIRSDSSSRLMSKMAQTMEKVEGSEEVSYGGLFDFTLAMPFFEAIDTRFEVKVSLRARKVDKKIEVSFRYDHFLLEETAWETIMKKMGELEKIMPVVAGSASFNN
jgi:hypothetical protein